MPYDNKVWCQNCDKWIKGKLYGKNVDRHIKSLKHIKKSVIDSL